jgi:hypothetical protein
MGLRLPRDWKINLSRILDKIRLAPLSLIIIVATSIHTDTWSYFQQRFSIKYNNVNVSLSRVHVISIGTKRPSYTILTFICVEINNRDII